MLAPTLVALLAAALPDTPTVEFENPRFLDEDGNLTLLTSSASVPFGVPGVILAEFDFLSDVTNPRTGQYEAGPIGVLWRISDAGGRVRTSAPDDEWIGLARRVDELFVLEFDPVTGLGSARLEIPVGTALADGSFHYPDLFEGSSTIDVALGHPDHLDVDANGVPVNAFAVGQIGVAQVDMPEAVVKLLTPVSGFAEEARAVVILGELLGETDVLVVRAVPEDRIGILEDTLLFEADTRAVSVDYVGLETGTFHLEVWRGEERLALSHRGSIVEPELNYATTGGGGGGSLPPSRANPIGGATAHPPTPTYGDNRDCKPAQSVPGAVFITCGKCKVNPTTPNCPGTAYQMSPAYCFSKNSATCSQATNDVTSPAYDFDGIQIVSCGEISGGGKIKIGGDDGGIEVGGGGSASLTKYCCTYTINTSAPSVTVGWQGCN